MDSIEVEKLRAVKYSRYKNTQVVIYNLVVSSLVALTCSFLCSYPFWFSSLTFSAKRFVFISLPALWSSFFNPKFLFIVFNVIVAFLVGESKLLGSSKPSPTNDIYSEYVERRRKYLSSRTVIHEERIQETNSKSSVCVSEESENKGYDDKEIVVLEHEEVKHQDDDEEFKEAENGDGDGVHEENIGEEAESEGLLPAEELNRRVEEFIARINKQRLIEARMLICGQA